ncbi:MAG: flagellar hook protein FlgE [Xanthomonadaceae bacterium]|nr:flagellar hook protein FlgE [Xanthomonadaceae bacterium]
MGILSSMHTARSGLQTMGDALGVYGDNIANSQTVGFKASRPEFSDIMVKNTMNGGLQIGRGVKLEAVTPLFTQGSILQTESPTDLSITGEGMFTLDGPDGRFYSRNGSLHFDREGKLVNAEGYRVLGFEADVDGRITSKMQPMQVARTVIDAKGTQEAKMFLNLDNRADPTIVFDPKRPDATSHFATGVQVIDSAGAPHILSMYFNRSESGDWTWRAMAKGEEVVGGQKNTMVEQASGKLIFDKDGRLLEQVTDNNSFNFKGGAQPDYNIKFNFGKDKKSGGDGLEVTQYGSDSEAYKTVADGYKVGTLTGLSFNEDGVLEAQYTNGESVKVAQIALAKFDAPEFLLKVGQNRFRETRNSGQPTIGGPRQAGRGAVASKSLETSTTDIANEFINLMNTERSFQANSRVISTADEMMQEILNLKK